MVNKIKSILRNAIEKACEDEHSESRSELHRNRSRKFVEAIGIYFRAIDDLKKDTYYVFTKHFDENRPEFGLNELLYDVLVCDTAKTTSVQGNRELSFVKKAIWQIESEFHKTNVRQLIWDFNKLVIGSGENKLFICSQRSSDKQEQLFLKTLNPLAACCSGNVYIAFVPHPENWNGNAPYAVKCLKYDNGHWV
jgi:hypothetical protein